MKTLTKARMENSARNVIKNPDANWLPVAGYEGLYEVSDKGDVWSCRSNIVLQPRMNNHGYLRVGLYTNCETKEFLVSRLVAIAFIPNEDPINKTQVNHILEFEKEDNSVDNLNWMTPKENREWGTRTERQIKTQTGKKHKAYKRTPEMVSDIKHGIRYMDFMNKYGVSAQLYYNIRKEIKWTRRLKFKR